MMCLDCSGIKYGLHQETFQISQLGTNLTTHSVNFSPVCQQWHNHDFPGDFLCDKLHQPSSFQWYYWSGENKPAYTVKHLKAPLEWRWLASVTKTGRLCPWTNHSVTPHVSQRVRALLWRTCYALVYFCLTCNNAFHFFPSVKKVNNWQWHQHKTMQMLTYKLKWVAVWRFVVSHVLHYHSERCDVR